MTTGDDGRVGFRFAMAVGAVSAVVWAVIAATLLLHSFKTSLTDTFGFWTLAGAALVLLLVGAVVSPALVDASLRTRRAMQGLLAGVLLATGLVVGGLAIVIANMDMQIAW